MSSEIVVVEKPDYVSWETIHEVLYSAHESTRKIGIYYPTAEMSGSELKEFVETRSGRCFVAMDGDKVVGTMSCYAEKVNTRFFKGEFLSLALIGNLPLYKGKGVFSKLYNVCYDYAKSQGLDGMTYGTAEKNRTMRKIFEGKGFIYNRCYYNTAKKRFVVGGIRCFNELPHKKGYYTLAFKFQQALVHLKYAVKR